MGSAVFHPLCLPWRQTIVGVMKIISAFKSTCAGILLFHAPDNSVEHCLPMSPPETPGYSQGNMAQSLVGTLFLYPGSWCIQRFVCALQESISPVLWKICNQIPLASKLKGILSPFLRSPGKEICYGSLRVQLFLLYTCSAVCGSSAQWLNGG